MADQEGSTTSPSPDGGSKGQTREDAATAAARRPSGATPATSPNPPTAGKRCRALEQHEALLQSSLFHLVSAYRAFLAEIAADIHLPPDAASPDVRSAARLKAAYADYLPPALMQCVNLEQAEPEVQGDMSDAWLALLLDWFASLERVGDTQPSPPLKAPTQ